ncbi:MAG TPA: molybdopterin-dependent oxidoreductase [Spirochaetia bacterium]|nr:molybdopterin-dependent oxidoreductase [Spirochaetales bacterium]HRW24012.1 molybdopterin-dependent oxidoreductase [Spirochaetia bacterium]
MKRNPDSALNVMGKTAYIDDLPESTEMLHAAIVCSPSAHGRYERLDTAAALAYAPGVRVLEASDVPGQNELSTSIPDEPMLSTGEWHFRGEVLALVLAPSRSVARRAAALVKLVGREDLPAVVDPREAYAQGKLIMAPRTQRLGDPEAAYAECDVVVTGRVESAGQEHVYLETQGALAYPDDAGGVRVVSSTQSPSGVQSIVARILGLPMNKVEIETRRLGGAFGGKEDQASGWAALAALGAYRTGKPVKLYLNRRDDMTSTGKRHPYSSDFKIGLKKDGTILAFEADYYQNAGAATDLSPAIIPRTLFHAANAYHIPNVRATGTMCRTNLVPFTAFRGFGGPQGVFVIECAIEKAARALGVDPVEIQRKNLLSEGDVSHYGMRMDDVRATDTFSRCMDKAKWTELRAGIAAYNAANAATKRGAAAIPICFGISFTKIMLNQGGALVHVYSDGSVSVSTGAVEMGQGVGRKIAVVASRTLGAPIDSVRVESTRTTTVANTVATAASSGADINAMAAQVACIEIKKRLVGLAAKLRGAAPETVDLRDGYVTVGGVADGELSFAAIVAKAFENRVDLSAHAFYATPGLHYDMKAEFGTPFYYHVYGCAVVTATLDVIRGSYRFDDAIIVHDIAESIDPLVDMGQVEGAFAQGLGWACLEELKFDDAGRLLADTLSTYKLPDAHFMPRMDVEFFTKPNPKVVANSKAVGEPPFIYGLAGYFAVLDALKAARPDGPSFHDLPMTPEKAMLFLTGDLGAAVKGL